MSTPRRRPARAGPHGPRGRGVRARAGFGAVCTYPVPRSISTTRPSPRAVVSRSIRWRSWVITTSAAGLAGEPLLQPLDRLEVEVVGRLVEHDQVELADQRLRQRHPLGLAARQFVGAPIEQRLHAERGARPRRPATSRRGTRRRCPAAASGPARAARSARRGRTAPRPRRDAWMPPRIRIRVDLPDPLTPTIATRSPDDTVNDSPSNSTLSGWATPTRATSTQITPATIRAPPQEGGPVVVRPPEGRRPTQHLRQVAAIYRTTTTGAWLWAATRGARRAEHQTLEPATASRSRRSPGRPHADSSIRPNSGVPRIGSATTSTPGRRRPGSG